MRKNVRRILGAVLAGAMILGTMAACGAEEVANSDSAAVESSVEGSVETAGVTYPLDTDETLTIAMINDKPVAAVSKDITATPFAKAWQEYTGVTIEFVICEDNNAMNLLFADGNLPDIVIWTPYSAYAGGPQAAIEDGIISPITREELEQYAPDYVAVLDNGHPDLNRTYKTDDGVYIGFGQIPASKEMRSASGMLVRGDWLDEWGMEVPDTIEELEAYLTKSLEVEGMQTPFQSSHLLAPAEYGYWTSPFGLVAAALYQVDGQVHCGYAEPEYKDFIMWARSLVEKGLMDTSFTYLENTVYGDGTAVWHASIGSGIGTYMAYAEDPTSGLGENWHVRPMPSLKGEDGVARAGYAFYSKPAGGRIAWLTPQCDNRELALQFLNYGYTEAGKMLFNFGVEGESYFYDENGDARYTDWITHNPDGLSMQYAMAQYNRAAVGGGPMVQTDEYARNYFWRPEQQEANKIWPDNMGEEYTMPEFTVDPADAAEYARLAADIKTYMEESRVKFVTGEYTADDFEAVYIPTLKDMGLDRYLEIIQEACDRFYAR